MPEVYHVDSGEMLEGVTGPNDNMLLTNSYTVDQRMTIMKTIDVDSRLAVPKDPILRKNFSKSVNKLMEMDLQGGRLTKEDIRIPYNTRWMKVQCHEELANNVHYCMLSCFSDFRFLATCAMPHFWGYNGDKNEYGMTVSLDHSIHFHAPLKATSWLLWVVESPRAFNGRGYITGRFYDQNGILVASVVQEALIRSKPKPGVVNNIKFKTFPPVLEEASSTDQEQNIDSRSRL
ncbi:hypothetical protein BB560_004297 [Smittium megazygosporum]|uniref:Acyl-CoA thioesterase 2 C-terminal domain-containing protein n=1 Tax=Smittium megazygosporum TaxID=133381 RepID=A0A2T9Z9M1_9FUNG|nr:hypothetical protein BB560_004297 [Smittium megazygosporum]